MVGCDLVIAGAICGVRRMPRGRIDVLGFVVRCVIEAVSGAAFVYGSVIFIFHHSKPSERLGYFATALVVVPAAVTCAYRAASATDAAAAGSMQLAWRRGRAETLLLLILTLIAIWGARIWGGSWISLKVAAMVLAARAVTLLSTRTGLLDGLDGWFARGLLAGPVALAMLSAVCLAPGFLDFTNLFYPALVALAIGALALIRRPASPVARHLLDAVAVVGGVLLVVSLTPPTLITLLNSNYFLGPALDIRHGHPMLVDTFSQYGVGMLDALAGIFSFVRIGYGTFVLLNAALTAVQWAVIYITLRTTIRSQLIAIVGATVAAIYYVFGPTGVYSDYASTGVLRFGLPWVVILLSASSAAVTREPWRRGLRVAVLVVVALAAQWSGEAGIYCLGAAVGAACLDALAMHETWSQRLRRLVAGVAVPAFAYVAGILLFTVLTRLASGRWADWGPYVDFIRLYTTGGLGAELIDPWSPGLLLGGLYAASAAAILGLGLVRPQMMKRRLPAFRAAASLTVLGPLMYTYFLGRSNPNNIVYVAPPAIALVYVWVGIASTAIASRRAIGLALAAATFAGAVAIDVARPYMNERFGDMALGALVEHPAHLADDVGQISENPPITGQALTIAAFTRSVAPAGRALTVITNPAFVTEALMDLDRANATGSSTPCQEELSATGASRLLRDVRNLRPGGTLVTADGPDYEPLTALQKYQLSLYRARFTLHPLRNRAADLIAYSLVSIRAGWNGGGDIAQPGPVTVPSSGCG